MVCHHLDPGIAEDVAFAESRIRRETIAAEDILHDLGAISMMSSRLAGDGARRRGDHAHLADRAQDEAAARAAARGATARHTTTSASSATSRSTRSIPAIDARHRARGRSIEVGKLADLVLWRPAFFGAKPALIIKGGLIVAALMGDPNASIPTPQPVHYRPMFGALGGARHATLGDLRVARRARGRRARAARLAKRAVAVRGTRTVAQARPRSQRRAARHRGRPTDLRGARRRRAPDVRTRPPRYRWRSATSCSEVQMARMLRFTEIVDNRRGEPPDAPGASGMLTLRIRGSPPQPDARPPRRRARRRR